ncbi:MAG: hypothetical protein ABIQ12_05305, partial [Opitutaceae bacterium]
MRPGRVLLDRTHADLNRWVMQDELTALLAGRRGHFQMESGYHSEQWFDLDHVLAQRERLRPFV